MIRTLLLLAVRVRRAFAWCRAVVALTGTAFCGQHRAWVNGDKQGTEAAGGRLYATDTSLKGLP
jgi:hypothetical protein